MSAMWKETVESFNVVGERLAWHIGNGERF